MNRAFGPVGTSPTSVALLCTVLVPGAVRQAAYDYYSKQVLEHVILGDRDFDPSSGEDHEFTDWDVLRAKIDGFLKEPA